MKLTRTQLKEHIRKVVRGQLSEQSQFPKTKEMIKLGLEVEKWFKKNQDKHYEDMVDFATAFLQSNDDLYPNRQEAHEEAFSYFKDRWLEEFLEDVADEQGYELSVEVENSTQAMNKFRSAVQDITSDASESFDRAAEDLENGKQIQYYDY